MYELSTVETGSDREADRVALFSKTPVWRLLNAKGGVIHLVRQDTAVCVLHCYHSCAFEFDSLGNIGEAERQISFA